MAAVGALVGGLYHVLSYTPILWFIVRVIFIIVIHFFLCTGSFPYLYWLCFVHHWLVHWFYLSKPSVNIQVKNNIQAGHPKVPNDIVGEPAGHCLKMLVVHQLVAKVSNFLPYQAVSLPDEACDGDAVVTASGLLQSKAKSSQLWGFIMSGSSW